MSTGFGSVVLLALVSLVCALWLVLRVARNAGTGWAIVTFIFWPIAGLILLRDWEGAGKSIAPAYLATMGSLVLYFFVAIPQIGAAIGTQQGSRFTSGAGGLQQFVESDDPADVELRLRQALGRLQFQRGEVSILEAHATLAIPRHFRLVPRSAIARLALDLGAAAPMTDVVGWLVHETVDLADEDSWYVEVRYSPIGHVAASDADELEAPALAEKSRVVAERWADGEYAFDSFSRLPAWRADIGTLTWGEWIEYPDESEKLIDCYAAKPTREGVLHFLAEYMPGARSELCERSVRLMAASTRFDRGWGYEDYSFWRDSRSGADFADLVTGAAFE